MYFLIIECKYEKFETYHVYIGNERLSEWGGGDYLGNEKYCWLIELLSMDDRYPAILFYKIVIQSQNATFALNP